MSLFPVSGALDDQNLPESQPSRTWYLNARTGRIQGEVEGLEAVRQAVEILLHTQRFRWQIYPPQCGVELDDLKGRDTDYGVRQLMLRIQQALLEDDRILSVDQFSYQIHADTLTLTMTVHTVFGDSQAGMEVKRA